MRFFIRNKTKYDPSLAFTGSIIAVDVDRTQEITKIKEEARKVGKGCKITALYSARQDGSFVDLADDRTINFYNLQDGMILETTSNPFWVTCLYSNMRRREQEAASNPEDAKLCALAQKSFIHRCMAIGLLLNGTGETEKQPATFHVLDELYEYCLTQGKKPAYMSQFTLDELQEMHEAYQEDCQNHKDPVGNFVYSQAVKLGYLQENNAIDATDPFRSHYGQRAEQQREVPVKRNDGQPNRNAAAGGGAGRRRPNNNRTCDDCEVTLATSYCAECSPPLCLCDACWRILHRGATRKNHQIKDISEAPKPSSYIPQAYRAPFAMLVAFHRASQERPQKLSLTAEEIKTRGQPFTDTDLEEAKQRGRTFSGFDSLENALIKHGIVLKEAFETPKYSLHESGQSLALKCSNFGLAVQALFRQAVVPNVPVPAARPVISHRQVCLLVDTEEPLKDRLIKVAQDRGLSAKVRKLPTGDFCWILLPAGAHAEDVPDRELVLPYLVERKTWDDLWTSVRSPRFENQVRRMKGCGIENLFYLVEGSPKAINGRPGPEVEVFLQSKLDRLLLEDKFFVNRTPSWLKTVEWLCHLTNIATQFQQQGGGQQWMTYSEFSRNANKVTANAATHAKPVKGIIWSASDFAANIQSHHRKQSDLGSVLDPRPSLSDSVLVIQGLTAYNTNSHSLMKKTLADYLKVPGQTAEECVRIHLEDSTDQLLSINVFQFYVLYLEVFKGVRIYRTETGEETQEFLSRFEAQDNQNYRQPENQNYNHEDVHDKPNKPAIPRVDDDNVMFANDSQEEEFMLQQALQQSLVAVNDAQKNPHCNRDDDDDDDAQNNSHYKKDDDDALPKTQTTSQHNPSQLPTTTTVDADTTHGIDSNNDGRQSSSPADVKCENGEGESDLESILQFKFFDTLEFSKIEEKPVDKPESKANSEDEEMRKAVAQSMLLYDLEQRKERELVSTMSTRSSYNEDEELRKVLELSKKDVVHNKMGGKGKNGNARCSVSSVDLSVVRSSYDEQEELRKVLELSKMERYGMNENRKDGNGNSWDGKSGNRKRGKTASSTDTSVQEISIDNDVENEAILLDSQEDREDCFYDLEVPDFANQQRHDTLDRKTKDLPTSTLQDVSCITPLSTPNNSYDRTTAGYSREASHSPSTDLCFTSTSSSVRDNEAIFVDSQDIDEQDDTVVEPQEQLRKDTGNSSAHKNIRQNKDVLKSTSYLDDVMVVDSQDDLEVDSDHQIALQLQDEYNQQAQDRYKQSADIQITSSNTGCPSDQISSYRGEQQKRFKESKTGKTSASKSPGLAFRQKALAIAMGKESLHSVARQLGSQGDVENARRRPEKRGFDGTIKGWPGNLPQARKSSGNASNNAHSETRIESSTIRPASTPFVSCFLFPASSSSPRPPKGITTSRRRDDINGNGITSFTPTHSASSSSKDSRSGSSFTFPASSTSSSLPGNGSREQNKSAGSFTFPGSSPCPNNPRFSSSQGDTANGFVFPGSRDSSSSSPRPPGEWSSHSTFSKKPEDAFKDTCNSQDVYGPKCSECGQRGHRKGTKRCPYYYTEEATRKREELARKRKELREEEDRQLQTRIDDMAAEKAEMVEQAEQIRIQIEQYNRRNDNLPKIVEDVMKHINKRRRK